MVSADERTDSGQSSWLRDALSEIDSNCDKLTIIGNPPPPPGRAERSTDPPRLRIQTAGNFGSIEVCNRYP